MSSIQTTQTIMKSFYVETGLNASSENSIEATRYLWTDAFAVCNFLDLYRHLAELTFLRQAQKLVDQVHYVLGQYHKNSSPRGSLSGISQEQAQLHPTVGGLRIGNASNEFISRWVFRTLK